MGRFVPENNYEAMIREFIKSKSKRTFVLITNVEQNKFYDQLLRDTGFDKDPRVKFVPVLSMTKSCSGTSVKMPLPYLHGHEVGGTNPFSTGSFSIHRTKFVARCWF